MNPFDKYKGARVIVLGASGFLGRWVARMLCVQGALVHLIVRDRARAEKVFAQYGITGETSELDLSNSAAGLIDLFRIIRPSITFNMAGYGVDPSEREEKAAYGINTELVKIACSGVASSRRPSDWSGQDLIHAGSALEYGAIGGNLCEDSEPNPTTLYGKSKLAGTQALNRSVREYGLKGLTARLFALYGPGEHDGRLLPSLIRCAETGETLEMTAGTQQRDFTYVEDAAEGLLRLGLCEVSPGSIVNVATGQLTSVRTFAETAIRLLSIPTERIRFGALPTRPEEMAHLPISIERLKTVAEWAPSTGVPDGISRTLSFAKTPLAERVG